MRLTRYPLDLPGVRRFWRSVEGGVDDGVSLVIACPGRDAADVLEGLASDRQRRGWSVTFAEVGALLPGPSERVLELHGDDLPIGTTVDARFLAQRDALWGRVLWADAVDCDEQAIAAWFRFLGRFSEASKAMRPGERMVVVTTIVGSKLPATPVLPSSVRTLWWWGLMGPLDVATFVDQEYRDEVDFHAADCATTVAKFDLELAARLMEQHGIWYGDPERLRSLLVEYAEERRWEHAAEIELSADAAAPSVQLREAWCRGELEWWNGRVEIHSAILARGRPKTYASSLLWEGQMRSLLPELEAQRKRLGWWVQERQAVVERLRLHSELHDASEASELWELEIGPLAFLVTRLVECGEATRSHIHYAHQLRLARNDLAHFNPIPTERLAELSRLQFEETKLWGKRKEPREGAASGPKPRLGQRGDNRGLALANR